MRIRAYVFKGRLCLIGVHDSPFGPIPISHHVAIEGVPDGQCEIGSESMAPPIAEAWEEAKPLLKIKLDDEMMKAGAEDLVRRANAGDQVAIAIMQLTRKRASGGDERAKYAYHLLLTEAKRGKRTRFGADIAPAALIVASQRDKEDPYRYPSTVAQLLRTDGNYYISSFILLANGPDLTKERVEAIASNFGEEERLFAEGYVHSQEPSRLNAFTSGLLPDQKKIVCIGQCVGAARRLQGLRSNEPIKKFSAKAAWELGE